MDAVKDCKIKLFADDTLLYVSADSKEEAVIKINSDLLRTDSWLAINKLKINVKETKYIVISNKCQPSVEIKICENKLEKVVKV